MVSVVQNWTGANLNALGSGGAVCDAMVYTQPNYSVMMFELDDHDIRVVQNTRRLCVAQLGAGIRPIGLGTEEKVREFCADLGKVWVLENPDDIGQTPHEQLIEQLQTQNRLLTSIMEMQERKIAALQTQCDELEKRNDELATACGKLLVNDARREIQAHRSNFTD